MPEDQQVHLDLVDTLIALHKEHHHWGRFVQAHVKAIYHFRIPDWRHPIAGWRDGEPIASVHTHLAVVVTTEGDCYVSASRCAVGSQYLRKRGYNQSVGKALAALGRNLLGVGRMRKNGTREEPPTPNFTIMNLPENNQRIVEEAVRLGVVEGGRWHA